MLFCPDVEMLMNSLGSAFALYTLKQKATVHLHSTESARTRLMLATMQQEKGESKHRHR